VAECRTAAEWARWIRMINYPNIRVSEGFIIGDMSLPVEYRQEWVAYITPDFCAATESKIRKIQEDLVSHEPLDITWKAEGGLARVVASNESVLTFEEIGTVGVSMIHTSSRQQALAFTTMLCGYLNDLQMERMKVK